MKPFLAAIRSAMFRPPFISTAQLLLHSVRTESTLTITCVSKAQKQHIRDRNITQGSYNGGRDWTSNSCQSNQLNNLDLGCTTPQITVDANTYSFVTRGLLKK